MSNWDENQKRIPPMVSLVLEFRFKEKARAASTRQSKAEIPIKAPQSLEGTIAYLIGDLSCP
jgi:hypothetical protein